MGAIQQALSGAANAAIGVAGTLKAKEMVDEQKELKQLTIDKDIADSTLDRANIKQELSELNKSIDTQKKTIDSAKKNQEYLGDNPDTGESISQVRL